MVHFLHRIKIALFSNDWHFILLQQTPDMLGPLRELLALTAMIKSMIDRHVISIRTLKKWVLTFVDEIGNAKTVHQTSLDQSMFIEVDAVYLRFKENFRILAELYPENNKLFNCFL